MREPMLDEYMMQMLDDLADAESSRDQEFYYKYGFWPWENPLDDSDDDPFDPMDLEFDNE